MRWMMRRWVAVLFGAAALVGCAAGGAQPEVSGDARRLILACEQAGDRVVLLDAEVDWAEAGAVVWSWSAAEDAAVAGEHAAWFNAPSDAKRVVGEDGPAVLTVASGGGVAWVDVETGEAQWYAYVGGNPHSAEALQGGRVAVVSSNGDRLTVLDPARLLDGRDEPASPRLEVHALSDAHGVAWDARRGCLWALGGKQILRLELGEDGALAVVATIDLPVTEASRRHPRHGGHDLSPIPWADAWFVSDMDHLWRFNAATGAFTALEPVHALASVKSVSQDGPGGEVIVVVATESWWSDTVRTLGGEWVRTLPGARFYKARWWGGALVIG